MNKRQRYNRAPSDAMAPCIDAKAKKVLVKQRQTKSNYGDLAFGENLLALRLENAPSHRAAGALPSGMQAMTPGTVLCVVSEGHDTAGLSPVSWREIAHARTRVRSYDCPLGK